MRVARVAVLMLLVGLVSGCSRSPKDETQTVKVPKILQESGAPQRAAQRLQDGCMAGDIPTCERWLRVLRRSCDLASSEACMILAGYSLRGLAPGGTVVVKADPAAAAAILQKHCDAGHRAGCEALAALYYKGVGLPQDVNRAVDLLCGGGTMTKPPDSLSRECAGGETAACRVLERCCAMGNSDACGSVRKSSSHDAPGGAAQGSAAPAETTP